jgi:hypothetical protein
MTLLRALSFSLATTACSAPQLPAGLTSSSGGTEGGGPVALDPALLDRSASNLDGDGCGYPSDQEVAYGIEVGDRVANFQLVDCDGNAIEFADYFCEREDIGVHNRAVLLNIGAGWCEPCRVETREDLPGVYEALHGQGVEIVQVLFQDWDGGAPPKSFCSEWKAGQWPDGDLGFSLAFPVLLDQTNDWRQIYLSTPAAQTPTNLLLDANANIRWKLAGDRPLGLQGIVEAVMETPYGP